MIRVAIDARIIDGSFGGVQTVVGGIAQGFRDLQEDDELDRLWLSYEGERWLEEFRPPRDGVLNVPRPEGAWRTSLVNRVSPRQLRVLKRVRRRLLPNARHPTDLLTGAEAVADRHVDVVHFPLQSAFLTHHPTIYQPHDLQHLHFPQYFDPAIIEARERSYRRFCTEARYVVVGSEIVRQDVIESYGIGAERVVVVPLAPNHALTKAVPADPGGVPEKFLLYPAVTWPHKNHENLIRGFSLLASSDPALHLLLCGAHTERTESLRDLARTLGVSPRVSFLGRVSDEGLAYLYRAATAVVVPTLFEAGSFPMWEAFQFDVPVACSDIAALRAQAQDGAAYFDPRDPHDLAMVVRRVLEDVEHAAALRASAQRRTSLFTWAKTARGYRALYRSVARGSALNEDPDWTAVAAIAF